MMLKKYANLLPFIGLTNCFNKISAIIITQLLMPILATNPIPQSLYLYVKLEEIIFNVSEEVFIHTKACTRIRALFLEKWCWNTQGEMLSHNLLPNPF